MIKVFRPPSLSDRVSAGLLILRFVVGLAFVFHGYGKIRNPFGWMGPGAGVPGAYLSPDPLYTITIRSVAEWNARDNCTACWAEKGMVLKRGVCGPGGR